MTNKQTTRSIDCKFKYEKRIGYLKKKLKILKIIVGLSTTPPSTSHIADARRLSSGSTTTANSTTALPDSSEKYDISFFIDNNDFLKIVAPFRAIATDAKCKIGR